MLLIVRTYFQKIFLISFDFHIYFVIKLEIHYLLRDFFSITDLLISFIISIYIRNMFPLNLINCYYYIFWLFLLDYGGIVIDCQSYLS